MSREEWESHWLATRQPDLNLEPYREQLLTLIEEISSSGPLSNDELHKVIRRFPYDGRHTFSKSQLVAAYRAFCAEGILDFERDTLKKLQR
ncbi:MAG: hypothetical protein ABFQ89_04005, partial [Chloroflexota bacterium]